MNRSDNNKALTLLRLGYRPYPRGHSLDSTFVLYETLSAAPYQGEPREDMAPLPANEDQFWVQRWVDIIVELWAGPIALEGATRRAQRDSVLRHVRVLFTEHQKSMLVAAYSEDLRAVRDYLKQHRAIIGSPPVLIEEWEKLNGPVVFS